MENITLTDDQVRLLGKSIAENLNTEYFAKTVIREFLASYIYSDNKAASFARDLGHAIGSIQLKG